MAGERTELKITPAESTDLSIKNDITIISSASATINTTSLILSNTAPTAIGRTSSAGVAVSASRSDHEHSGANLLLDGGNY